MSRTPMLTSLGYALLGLIGQAPRSGYALMKLFKTTPMGRYSGSPGAIYPALKGLEGRGLIRGIVEQRSVLRPRRVYQLTAEGRRAFRRWLAQPITLDDAALRDEELTLRFALMEGVLSEAAVLEFLEAFATAFDEYAASIEHLLDDPAMSVHGAMALEGGIQGYRTRAVWARRAIERLRSAHAKRSTRRRTRRGRL